MAALKQRASTSVCVRKDYILTLAGATSPWLQT
ncbi:rCG56460 [Rattus norvegicus]|uniref:RCG56460 n=1 Tax=Rattus norvegicus TaxID=10116 RepID=A6IBH8_RAT|nr:rCG56460 [Rattus norvegicus]